MYIYISLSIYKYIYIYIYIYIYRSWGAASDKVARRQLRAPVRVSAHNDTRVRHEQTT